ncbi:ribbon-helix-helix DNA binding domain protein [Microbacterium phage Gshelby23]|nr:ribbon-helix-helix DNA binding domain protein [Microbacterium phage Gshelby23]
MKTAPAGSRNLVINTRVDDAELERIQWAAKELGLNEAAFTRMAALKMAKEVLG